MEQEVEERNGARSLQLLYFKRAKPTSEVCVIHTYSADHALKLARREAPRKESPWPHLKFVAHALGCGRHAGPKGFRD